MWPNQTSAVQDGGDFEGGDEVIAGTPVPLRAARVVFLSSFGLFTLCANAGIVWYEQRAPSIQKTLVNKLVSWASVSNMLVILVHLPILLARISYFDGVGLWSPICRTSQIVFLGFPIQMLLLQCEIILCCYAYICRLNTVGSINEDLLELYLFWLNMLLTLLVCTWSLLWTGDNFAAYQYCTGNTFDPDVDILRRVTFSLLVTLVALTQVTVSYKIHLKEKKMGVAKSWYKEISCISKSSVVPIQDNSQQFSTEKNISLQDTGSSLLFVSLIGGTSVAQMLVSVLMVGELRFPRVLVSTFQVTTLLLLPLSIYARKPQLRKAVANEMKKFKLFRSEMQML